MYNNTLTLSEEYNTSSTIISDDEKFYNAELSGGECSDELISDNSYLYSIELNRNKIKKELRENFDFETHYEELDFLASFPELVQILPTIANYIKSYFDEDSKLVLELMSENEAWQTLFVNIHTCMEWNKSNKFVDGLYDNLFELFPDIALKLNVNIVPHEL